ncbi:MAG: NUDIX hydrolase [Acidobacteriota bacterium]
MSDRATVLKRERVYEGKLLKIDREEVALPGGKHATLESIRHPGAAAVVPFLGDGRVVLIRQYRHATGGYLLEIPAGKLDAGEAPERCAAREVEEETGYSAGRLELLGSILTTPGFTDEVIWLYQAHELQFVAQRLESDEVIETLLVPFDEAIAWVQSGKIRDAKSVSALLLAWARRRSLT